jgi:ribonuclease P protein component
VKFSSPLKKNYEFRRLYSKGKSAASPFAVVYCRKNRTPGGKSGIPVNKIGITVSTKLGKAVCRNRIRRRYREIYRLNEEKLAPGYDIVTVARSRSKGAPYRVMEADFMNLCRKLGILRSQASQDAGTPGAGQ